MPDSSKALAAHRPLQWWSATALDTLARTINRAWQDWAARWGVAAQAVEAFNAHETLADQQVLPGFWRPWLADAHAAAPWSWISAGGDEPSSVVAALMFGTASDGATAPARVSGTSLAAEVAQRAWAEFEDDLARLMGHAPSGGVGVGEFAQGVGPKLGRWSGAACVRLRWGQPAAPDLWLHLGADSIAPLLKNVPKRWTGLMAPIDTTVVDAIAHKPFVLRVELNSTELDLGALQSLRVGDVLTLSHRLDMPLLLRPHGPEAGAAAAVACAGYLGARNGRRAIELVQNRRA